MLRKNTPPATIEWLSSTIFINHLYLRMESLEVPGWLLASGTDHLRLDPRCTELVDHWRCLSTPCWFFLKPSLILKLKNKSCEKENILQDFIINSLSWIKQLGMKGLNWCCADINENKSTFHILLHLINNIESPETISHRSMNVGDHYI